MDVGLLVSKVIRRVRQVGIRATLKEGLDRRKAAHQTDPFDMQHGTDTGGVVGLYNLTVDSPNVRFGVKYQATDAGELTAALKSLPEDFHSLTFIDLGCGKGRTLLVAAGLGFKQVIGVEFAKELADIARKNLQTMQIPNAGVVLADAAQYQFPDGDLVVYIYNAFSREVMQGVVENLRRSLSNRKIYVVYKVPECADLFDGSGFLARVGPPRPGWQVWLFSPAQPA